MLGGIDHNSGMSGPDGQVAGLRPGHPPEFVNPRVEVRRGRVFIGEPGVLIECVDQVRAVGGKARTVAGIECDTQNGQALMPSQGPGPSRLSLILLCQRGRDARQAEQKQ
jgi:hypothetical protein